MAEPTPTDFAPNEEEPSGLRPFALLGRIKVIVFILVLVVIECAAAYVLIPSAAETEAAALKRAGGDSVLDISSEDLEGEEEEKQEKVEIDLTDPFSVTSFDPVTNTTLRIDFKLKGVVFVDDQSECTSLLADHQHRFREQVIIILRSAEINDLTDASLGLIKRKILEKSNRTLGKPLLQEILIPDFSFVEQ